MKPIMPLLDGMQDAMDVHGLPFSLLRSDGVALCFMSRDWVYITREAHQRLMLDALLAYPVMAGGVITKYRGKTICLKDADEIEASVRKMSLAVT